VNNNKLCIVKLEIMLTDRQLEIVQTSIQLIAQKGIQGLTLKNLSKEIGISEPAIYRHYENKIEILISILDYFIEHTMGIFTTEIQKQGSAIDKIERIFMSHFEVFSSSPALVAVIFSEEIFRNEPVLTQRVKDIMERNSRAINTIIEEGKASGQFEQDVSSKHMTIIIMGSLRLLVKQWQMADFGFDLRNEGAAFFQSLKKIVLTH